MSDNTTVPDKDEPRDIYVARMAGRPGYVAACVNDPKWAKETAKDLADWVKSGYEIVGLVTRSESVRGMNEFFEDKQRRAAEPKTADLPQDGLFA